MPIWSLPAHPWLLAVHKRTASRRSIILRHRTAYVLEINKKVATVVTSLEQMLGRPAPTSPNAGRPTTCPRWHIREHTGQALAEPGVRLPRPGEPAPAPAA